MASAPPSGWPPVYGLLEFDDLDSTNEEARRQAEAGVPGPLWIRAGRQNVGRGRRGRPWVSSDGNLMCTLMMRPDRPTAEVARLSFVAALAVRHLLTTVRPGLDVLFKWPNDVLIGGAKVAGILLESAAARSARPEWLAVGIGVNLAASPDGIPYPVTALGRHMPPGRPVPTPREALAELARGFLHWYRQWERSFEPVRAAWLAHAYGLGRAVTVDVGGESIAGRFEGIDDAGALVLVSDGGIRRTLPAGEVFFAAPDAGRTVTRRKVE